MGSYTVEQVEFLRQRADITYEEALEVLERCGGDLTRCLVDLERRGKIRKNGAAQPYTAHTQRSYTRRESRRENVSFSLSGLIKKLMRMHLVVTKQSSKEADKVDICLDLPVLFMIFVALFAPHLVLISVILMFVFGMKIRVENNDGEKIGNDQFYDTVDKVADNIKTTVTNFARSAQESVEKARRADVEKNTPYAAQSQEASEPVVYAQPTVQEEKTETEPEIDIPEVTPYEEFTGTESTDEVKKEPGEENEITIG